MDVLGCDLGAAETGACSATPAGEAEMQIQSGSGCAEGFGLRSGLSGDQFGTSGRDSRSGAVLYCWGGEWAGFLGHCDQSQPFYNGMDCLSPREAVDDGMDQAVDVVDDSHGWIIRFCRSSAIDSGGVGRSLHQCGSGGSGWFEVSALCFVPGDVPLPDGRFRFR